MEGSGLKFVALIVLALTAGFVASLLGLDMRAGMGVMIVLVGVVA